MPLIFSSQVYSANHLIDRFRKPQGNNFFFSVALRPNAGYGLLILEVSRSHTSAHHRSMDFSGRVISPSQRPLPGNNTQHSTQTDIHVPGGIRTHNPSKRAAVDPRLRPRGHWDWHRAVNKRDKYVCVKRWSGFFWHRIGTSGDFFWLGWISGSIKTGGFFALRE